MPQGAQDLWYSVALTNAFISMGPNFLVFHIKFVTYRMPKIIFSHNTYNSHDSESLYVKMGCCYLVIQSCPTICNPWLAAHQASLSRGFSQQEYWSGLAFSSPGYISGPGIESKSSALAGGFSTIQPPGKPKNWVKRIRKWYRYWRMGFVHFHLLWDNVCCCCCCCCC